MSYRILKVASALAALALIVSAHAVTAQEIINLHSGNGSIGSPDSHITFLYKGDGAIGPFSAADFASARNGTPAIVVNPGGPYARSLPADPAAQWIAADAGINAKSALYAYTFQVDTSSIMTATLELHFAVDNFLGQATVPGLYINEQPLSGTNRIGNFDKQYDYTNSSIGSLLHPGANTLYFYQYDEGVVAASLFSVKISVASVVPTTSISGKVKMQGIVGYADSQNVTFVARPVNSGNAITQIVSVPPSGDFNLTGLGFDQYTLHIKASKYLATNVNVDTRSGNVSGVTATLPAGDTNNDNSVDIGDFGILVGSYSLNSSDSTGVYDSRADLNGDGSVDIGDFGLLIGNYGLSGDN